MDIFIIAMSYLAVLVAFKRNMTVFNVHQGLQASRFVEENKANTEKLARKAWRKEVREQYRTLKKEIKSGRQNGQGGNIALIIVGGVILIVILGLLSCVIACEGTVFLGVALFVVGAGAIIYGMVRWIRKIKAKS